MILLKGIDRLRKYAPIAALLLLFAWVAVVIASGFGWNPSGISWNFTNTGAFGDSFGPLGALMAGAAAIAAFETLREQRAEFRRIAAREKIEDRRREEAAAFAERQRRLRQASEARQLFERTFFSMMETLREIVKETDVGSDSARKTSRDAFKALSDRLKFNFGSSRDLKKSWDYLLNQNMNDLNHYFRFLYHTIRFVHLQESVDRYSYIRLIRASLSEAELVLISINCAIGEGREKFKPLIEQYALLHNISSGARSFWGLDSFFEQSAFEYGEF